MIFSQARSYSRPRWPGYSPSLRATIVTGADYDAALKALARILEPGRGCYLRGYYQGLNAAGVGETGGSPCCATYYLLHRIKIMCERLSRLANGFSSHFAPGPFPAPLVRPVLDVFYER